jgi:adenine-specific DNA-methyltransferase
MADRCTLSSGFLGNAGILAAAIDDEEVLGLRYLLSMIFEQELGIAVVRSNPAGRKTKGKLAPAHEYLLLYGKTAEATPSFLDVTDERLKRFPLQDEYGNYAWANFIRSGSHDKREDRPKLFYPIFVSQNGHIRVPAIEWNEEKRSYDLLEQPLPGEQVVYPVVRQGGKIIEKNWQRGHERVRRELDRGWYRVRKQEDGSLSIDFKTYMDEQALPTTWWDDKEYCISKLWSIRIEISLWRKGSKSTGFS